jgi:hypothetical protein
MRSYKAARREATKEPVKFAIGYEDADGTEQEETFTCVGEVSSLVLSEMAYNADVDIATPEGAGLLRQFFAGAFGDDKEYQRFFRFVMTQGLSDDILMDVMQGVVEDFAGRPTKRPSDLPATPSTSGQGSRVVSLPGGFRTEATPVEPELEQAVERLASSS